MCGGALVEKSYMNSSQNERWTIKRDHLAVFVESPQCTEGTNVNSSVLDVRDRTGSSWASLALTPVAYHEKEWP